MQRQPIRIRTFLFCTLFVLVVAPTLTAGGAWLIERDRQQAGASRFDAVVEAAQVRLRPILMTSACFVHMVPPYFATGAGGMLQAMLNGFGGLEITPTGIVQSKTHLPANWKTLKMTGIGASRNTYMVK